MTTREKGVYWIIPKVRGKNFSTLANYDPDRAEAPWEMGDMCYTEEQITNLYNVGTKFDELRYPSSCPKT
jgi:hypothetical protein